MDTTPKRAKAPGSGRKKGTPNKLTASVKEAILAAFDEVGGKDYLLNVAREDHKTFCRLLEKLVPAEIKADLGLGGEELIARLEAGRRRVESLRANGDAGDAQ